MQSLSWMRPFLERKKNNTANFASLSALVLVFMNEIKEIPFFFFFFKSAGVICLVQRVGNSNYVKRC